LGKVSILSFDALEIVKNLLQNRFFVTKQALFKIFMIGYLQKRKAKSGLSFRTYSGNPCKKIFRKIEFLGNFLEFLGNFLEF